MRRRVLAVLLTSTLVAAVGAVPASAANAQVVDLDGCTEPQDITYCTYGQSVFVTTTGPTTITAIEVTDYTWTLSYPAIGCEEAGAVNYRRQRTENIDVVRHDGLSSSSTQIINCGGTLIECTSTTFAQFAGGDIRAYRGDFRCRAV